MCNFPAGGARGESTPIVCCRRGHRPGGRAPPEFKRGGRKCGGCTFISLSFNYTSATRTHSLGLKRNENITSEVLFQALLQTLHYLVCPLLDPCLNLCLFYVHLGSAYLGPETYQILTQPDTYSQRQECCYPHFTDVGTGLGSWLLRATQWNRLVPTQGRSGVYLHPHSFLRLYISTYPGNYRSLVRSRDSFCIGGEGCLKITISF